MGADAHITCFGAFYFRQSEGWWWLDLFFSTPRAGQALASYRSYPVSEDLKMLFVKLQQVGTIKRLILTLAIRKIRCCIKAWFLKTCASRTNIVIVANVNVKEYKQPSLYQRSQTLFCYLLCSFEEEISKVGLSASPKRSQLPVTYLKGSRGARDNFPVDHEQMYAVNIKASSDLKTKHCWGFCGIINSQQ